MASAVYNNAKLQFVTGNIDWENDDIRVLLVDDGHIFDVTDDFVDDVVADEVSGTGYARTALAGKDAAIDVGNSRVECDANDVSYTALDAGTIAAAVVYKHVTNDADSILIAFIDFDDLVTNGGDVNIVWNAEGLFYI